MGWTRRADESGPGTLRIAVMVAKTPLPPPAPAGWPDVPDYQVLGKLGGGGMGIVYKALQLSAERVVALKVIRQDYLKHNTLLLRFQREHRLLARLAHPNVVVLYDAGKAGQTPFFTMEYVKGIDLGELVKRRGRLPVGWACEFVRQAALGLQHAADQGVVHRDIKPSNLMVTLPPERARELAELGAARPGAAPFPFRECVVKILDMGLARFLLPPAHGEEYLKTLTQTREFMGTPDFVAPEQVADAHGVDVRADVYSLGCTFYYLLTRQVLFPGCTPEEKLRKHREEYPSPVELLRPEVPPDVADVLRQMIDKDPGRRFQTPAELARALEPLCTDEYLASLPPPAEAVPEVPTTRPPVRTRGAAGPRPPVPSGAGALPTPEETPATAAFRPAEDVSFVGRLASREAGEV